MALPLDASVAAVGGSQLVHQRRRGLALAVAGDGLDLVGVGNVRHHVPTHTNKINPLKIVVIITMIRILVIVSLSERHAMRKTRYGTSALYPHPGPALLCFLITVNQGTIMMNTECTGVNSAGDYSLCGGVKSP